MTPAQQAFAQFEAVIDPSSPSSDEEIQRACITFRAEVLVKLEPSPLKTAAELELLLLVYKRVAMADSAFPPSERRLMSDRVTDHITNLSILHHCAHKTQETQQ